MHYVQSSLKSTVSRCMICYLLRTPTRPLPTAQWFSALPCLLPSARLLFSLSPVPTPAADRDPAPITEAGQCLTGKDRPAGSPVSFSSLDPSPHTHTRTSLPYVRPVCGAGEPDQLRRLYVTSLPYVRPVCGAGEPDQLCSLYVTSLPYVRPVCGAGEPDQLCRLYGGHPHVSDLVSYPALRPHDPQALLPDAGRPRLLRLSHL